MKMPIGANKGRDVAALPTNYLTWLVSQDSIRFRHWPLVKEALRVLRKRFESFEDLLAELQVDTPTPEYWKTAKGANQKKAEKAEKLRALEQRRAEEMERRRAKRRDLLMKKTQAASIRLQRIEPPPTVIIDASLYVAHSRQQIDPNDVSDLL